MTKKFQYNLYLLKDDVTTGEDALSYSANATLSAGVADEIILKPNLFYDDWNLFVFYPDEDDPKWKSILSSVATLPTELTSKQSSALLFIKERGRWFVLTFGASRHYLDSKKIVMDFGLRSIVNMIEDDEVRYREGNNVSTSTRDASQSSFVTRFSSLVDSDRVELVKAISGKMAEFGNVSGSTSLKFSSENSVGELHWELWGALSAYESDNYKGSTFEVIDQLAPVRDKVTIRALDLDLVNALRAKTKDFEISIPELIDHQKDVSFVRFMSMDLDPIPEFPDAGIDEYYSLLGARLALLDIEGIKRNRIEARSSDGSFVNGGSIYRCLIGSIDSAASGTLCKYVLNEGHWYLVDDDFKKKIDSFFQSVRSTGSDGEFDAPRKKTVSGAKRKSTTSGYEKELDYNTRIAKSHNFVLMDQQLVDVFSEPGRGFEICDLFDFDNKRLIHVKKSSRSSSILSHFFLKGSSH